MKIFIAEASVDQKRNFIKNLLKEAGSRFITVEFSKKDGTNRVMNIQQAALKFNVLGESASETGKKAVATRKRNNPNLLAVWDNTKQAIRSINLDTVHTVRYNHIEYVFKPQDERV